MKSISLKLAILLACAGLATADTIPPLPTLWLSNNTIQGNAAETVFWTFNLSVEEDTALAADMQDLWWIVSVDFVPSNDLIGAPSQCHSAPYVTYGGDVTDVYCFEMASTAQYGAFTEGSFVVGLDRSDREGTPYDESGQSLLELSVSNARVEGLGEPQIDPTAVPEPGTFLLLGTCIAGLALRRWLA